VDGRDEPGKGRWSAINAEHWAHKEIVILDDGTTWGGGAGVANGVRRRFARAGRFGRLGMRQSPRTKPEYPSLV
jgi:hypothetical protein